MGRECVDSSSVEQSLNAFQEQQSAGETEKGFGFSLFVKTSCLRL